VEAYPVAASPAEAVAQALRLAGHRGA